MHELHLSRQLRTLCPDELESLADVFVNETQSEHCQLEMGHIFLVTSPKIDPYIHNCI